MGKCCREIEVRIKISRLHFTIMRRIFDKNVFYYNNISIKKKKKNTRKRNSFLAKEKGKKKPVRALIQVLCTNDSMNDV